MIFTAVIPRVAAPPLNKDEAPRRVRPPHCAGADDLAPCCLGPLPPTLLLPPAL